jgi:hypothetical protein
MILDLPVVVFSSRDGALEKVVPFFNKHLAGS